MAKSRDLKDAAVLNNKLEHIHEDVKRIADAVEKQNGRVRKLENWRNILTGAGIVILALVSYGIIKLTALF